MSREVTGVVLGADTIELTVMDRADVRDVAGEPVVLVRTVVVGRSNAAFADDIEAVEAALDELAGDVLEEHAGAEVFVEDQDDDDEDAGMGGG